MSHPTWRTGPRVLFYAEGGAPDTAPPEPRCRHCGKRKGDHGLMSGHCFVRGKVVRTKFEAAGG